MKIIVATGTPVSESPENAYSILKLLKPELIPSRARFMDHFCVREEQQYLPGRYAKVTVGYKNLGELKEYVEMVSKRKLKCEIEGRPSKTVVFKEVSMGREQGRIYDEIKEKVRNEIRKEFGKVVPIKNAMSRLIRLRQVLNHPGILDFDCGSAKHDRVEILAEEILENPDAKLIVWSIFKRGCELLRDRLGKRWKTGIIYGDSKKDEIEYLRKNFDKDDTRIVVCTPDKAGTGLDFLKRARTAIYVDRPWSYIMWLQSQDRIDRRDNVDGATIMVLNSLDTIDDLVDWKLDRKADISEAITVSNDLLVTMGKSELLKYLE